MPVTKEPVSTVGRLPRMFASSAGVVNSSATAHIEPVACSGATLIVWWHVQVTAVQSMPGHQWLLHSVASPSATEPSLSCKHHHHNVALHVSGALETSVRSRVTHGQACLCHVASSYIDSSGIACNGRSVPVAV